MVIAKLSLTENSYLLNTKRSLELEFVFNLSMVKNVLYLALFSDRISTSNIVINNPQHNNCVTLHMLYLGSMFHNNIKIHAFFTLKIKYYEFFKKFTFNFLTEECMNFFFLSMHECEIFLGESQIFWLFIIKL